MDTFTVRAGTTIIEVRAERIFLAGGLARRVIAADDVVPTACPVSQLHGAQARWLKESLFLPNVALSSTHQAE
jgi:hypothetical protein